MFNNESMDMITSETENRLHRILDSLRSGEDTELAEIEADRKAMKDDPVIQAVRDARHQISESVGHDPKKLIEYYRQRQKMHPDRLVHRQFSQLEPQDKNAG